jgi:hypothetical protein
MEMTNPISREQIVFTLRRVGMSDLASEAETTLPERVTPEEVEAFSREHNLSRESLMDVMGGSV